MRNEERARGERRQRLDGSPGSSRTEAPAADPAAPPQPPPVPPATAASRHMRRDTRSANPFLSLPENPPPPPNPAQVLQGMGKSNELFRPISPRRFPDIPQARSRFPQPAAIPSFPRHGEKKTTPAASSARVKPGNGAGTVPDGNMNKM